MKRLALVVAIIAALAGAVVIAMRVRASQEWLVDLPAVGPVFEAIADVIGVHSGGPVDFVYRVEREPTPDVLAAITRRAAPARVEMRGGQLVITATSGDMLAAPMALERALSVRSVRVFVVVYESEELDRIGRALRADDEAKKLRISVDLDRVGYHLHAPSDVLYVNPEWAARHRCEGHHIESMGTACYVAARDRLAAYERGDPGLFIDAHANVFALPAGRAFYATAAGDSYELEAPGTEIVTTQLTGISVAEDALEVIVPPDAAAALLARTATPATELVAEIAPGVLHAASIAGNRLTIEGAADRADDLRIASAGLHAIR